MRFKEGAGDDVGVTLVSAAVSTVAAMVTKTPTTKGRVILAMPTAKKHESDANPLILHPFDCQREVVETVKLHCRYLPNAPARTRSHNDYMVRSEL